MGLLKALFYAHIHDYVLIATSYSGAVEYYECRKCGQLRDYRPALGR